MLNQIKAAIDIAEHLKKPKADFNAKADINGSSYKVILTNTGKGLATNVQVTEPEGQRLFVNLDDFPMDIPPNQPVSIIAVRQMNTPSKKEITVTWSDDCKEKNEKTLSIFGI